MRDHAIANGMWIDEAASILEYAELSEMETIYLESTTAPNGNGWQEHETAKPNLCVSVTVYIISVNSPPGVLFFKLVDILTHTLTPLPLIT